MPFHIFMDDLGGAVSQFYDVEPSLDNYWRSIILFGNNVASYKFALACSLYELSNSSDDFISLEQLAGPFSRHICEHLKEAPKQTTSRSSKFLSACSDFNLGRVDEDYLCAQTVRLGFQNVIDAFHNVNRREVDKRFFIDERKTTNKGIRLTENFYTLMASEAINSIKPETDARWRLVESAWQSGLARNLLRVEHDHHSKQLFTHLNDRRVNITSSRDSLNGYQKGRCFYCFDHISIQSGATDLADVDHFFPWSIREYIPTIDGIWNLVLACQSYNRGEDGKFAQLPHIDYLYRLHARNEYFINSHLPIRETLIQQTGKTKALRKAFLQHSYDQAKFQLLHSWKKPEPRGSRIF
ncbi:MULTISPECIES: HNH endonuclease domain-containing protein [unclassified Endozoicomonas]|uniref:HNH endonuclease domain-containing protein n=1 Tax=unclassified Endozoicomonas TaxID=2644528 RepID=UPI003BB69A23